MEGNNISSLDKNEKEKIFKLFMLFTALGVIFISTSPGATILKVLLFCAIAWFILEVYKNIVKTKFIIRALMLGIFLMVFDFIVENSGAYFGLWETYNSMFMVLHVPIEIMLVCLFGGAAWFMYLPRSFKKIYSFYDTCLFSLYGAIGESILILNGLMSYMLWWTPLHAFFGYFITWVILNYVSYKILPDKGD